MSYKIKKSKSKEIPVEYWREQEIARLRKKSKGHLPPISEIARVTNRRVSGIEQRVHRKGATVQYKSGIAEVQKVTKKGLWIEPFNKPTDKSIAYPSGKLIFIPEKRVEHEIYPITTNLPVYLYPTMQIEF